MTKIIIDIETSIKEAFGRRGNPFIDNYIVLIGIKELDKEPLILDLTKPNEKEAFISILTAYNTHILFIGHNIKFDMLFLFNKHPTFKDLFICKQCEIYDTMVGEYLLSGQTIKMPSLNQVSLKYGGELKDSRIAEAWEAGIETIDIDRQMLKDYLKGDLENTEKVFKAQVKQLKTENMVPLAKAQMECLLATTMMELNGMYFKWEEAEKELKTLELKQEYLTQQLNKLLNNSNICVWPKEIEINWGSTKHLTCLFFGGEIKTMVKQPILNEIGEQVTYKTGEHRGEPKYKNADVILKIPGLGLDAKRYARVTDKGNISTDGQTLENISLMKNKLPGMIASIILEKRLLDKHISTYYTSLIDKTDKSTSIIRPEFNHAVTVTGRLSSSNPNMQNISGKKLEEEDHE